MEQQETVAAFLAANNMETHPAYHALDLASEVGELAKEVTASTDYGADPDAVAVADDELGDALFALLALATAADVDAGEALREALDKYERRIDDTGNPGSGA